MERGGMPGGDGDGLSDADVDGGAVPAGDRVRASAEVVEDLETDVGDPGPDVGAGDERLEAVEAVDRRKHADEDRGSPRAEGREWAVLHSCLGCPRKRPCGEQPDADQRSPHSAFHLTFSFMDAMGRRRALCAMVSSRAARRALESARGRTWRGRGAGGGPRSGRSRSCSMCLTSFPTLPGGCSRAVSLCANTVAIWPLALATIGTLAAAYSKTLSGEK